MEQDESSGGLALPARLQLVAARGVASAPSSNISESFDASADYFQVVPHRSVYDTALEPLERLDGLLRVLSQAGTSSIIDGVPYLAQVERVPRRGADPGAAGAMAGRSFGGAVTHRGLATMRSTRIGAGRQTVEMWLPGVADGVAFTIRARVTIERAISVSSPFGEFTLDYAATAGGGLSRPLFFGSMQAFRIGGEAEYLLFHDAGDIFGGHAPGERSERLEAHARMTPGGDAGDAKVLARRRFNEGGGDSGVEVEQFLLGFNDELLVRAHDGDTQVIRSRESIREIVFGYELFLASGPTAGAAVQLEEGFGFRTASGRRGFVGPRGPWLEVDPVELNGEAAARSVYGEVGEELTYSVVAGPGRLVRHRRRDLPLTAVADIDFEWSQYDVATNTTSVRRVSFVMGQWTADALFDFEGGRWDPLEPPEVIDTGALGHLDLWSPALGGPVAWLHGEALVYVFDREPVDADDSVFGGGATTLELFGLGDCLRPGITQAEADVGDVYFDVPAVDSPFRFEFHAGDLTLYFDGGGALARVGLAGGAAPAGGPNAWGMVSGPLVPSVAGFATVSEIFATAEFYTYETGHNPWNAYLGLRDAGGAMVRPEEPLRFEYTHAAASDRNGSAQFEGRTFLLEYSGRGRLTGLPQAPVDRNGDGVFDRYEPRVNLIDGLLVGPTGTEFVVRAIDIEEVPRAGFGPVPSLSVASDLVFNGGSEYQAPDIGSAPLVEDPPRVIEGRVFERESVRP